MRLAIIKSTLNTIAIFEPLFGLINIQTKEKINGTITKPELMCMPISLMPPPQKEFVTVTFCDKKNKPTTSMISPPQKYK